MKPVLAVLIVAVACTGAEPVAVELPVVSGAERVEAVTTDLGYTVRVERARAAIRDLQFTTDGEVELSLAARASRWLVGTAHAHPGHGGGGEVIGELLGDRVIDWTDGGATIGTGTLLAGDYDGANFLFRAATEADGLAAGDPLVGHAAHLAGTVERDGDTWPVEMVLDVEEGTALIGAPFDLELGAGDSPTIALQLATLDPFEGDTLFDGVDFAALVVDGAIAIGPGSDAHNIVRRALTRHDHYVVEAR